jgi:hypothetical protein
MAEHQSSPATASRSPNKSSWLAALDELEKQFLVFQKRCAGPISSAHADRAAPDIAPHQLDVDPGDSKLN